ncbi:hypothetical protein BDE36_1768 [Arcticibacter tournemirensis]|nr:hypothetical protein BDE36_1768 [Arcticibacter tournemirensis]
MAYDYIEIFAFSGGVVFGIAMAVLFFEIKNSKYDV